ncbi:MAG: hypothetical protein WCD28_05215 [Nitrososphaeraceae archaeon]|jgi:hypothetical protein
MSTAQGRNRKNLLEKLYERDYSIRGKYLISASSLDSLIRDIISYHFCPPGQDVRRGQFISLILEQHLQESHSVLNLLEKIISMNYSDQLKKYPALFGDLRGISDYTLWLSSALLDTSKSLPDNTELEDVIRLTYYDQSGVLCHREVSQEQIEEKISDCSNLHFALEDIRSEIRDKILTESR